MYKDYFQNLLASSEDMNWYELDFIDNEIEQNYRLSNQLNEDNNSKNFSIVVIIHYILSIGVNIMLNDKQLVRSGYILIGGIILELILVLFSYRIRRRYTVFSYLKILRFLIVYFVYMIILCFPVKGFTPDLFLRTLYVLILFVNMYYILFMHFNFVILVLIPIFNSLSILWVQYNAFVDSPYYLFPELFANFIYQYCIFLIKKNNILSKKRMFLKNYRNQSHIQYITELVDVLNIMVISIKNNEILYLNQYALNFIENLKNQKNKKENSIYLSSLSDNKEKEFFVTDEKTRKEFFNNQLEEFLNSIYLEDTHDSPCRNMNNMISLSQFIKENLFSDNDLSNVFIKIGIFTYNFNNNEKSFEVYARKVNINDEFLELMIYDISSIKTVEKAKVESKYKQKILSKIAHEFKTPLITIISLIQSINYKHLRNEIETLIKRKLSHVVNLSNYTIFLIQDIIQYVSESSKLRIDLSNVNLKEILKFCYEVLVTLVDCNENKSLNIETFLDFDSGINELKILSDENRLKQILLNLISNSVKFTATGYIKLKTNVDYENNMIIICVEDTGLGIKKEDFSLIFQDNIKLNLEKDYNTKGSGLGLGICKVLANSLDHEIKFESKYMEGTKFSISMKFENSMKNSVHKESYHDKDLETIFKENSFIPIRLNKLEPISDSIHEISFKSSKNYSVNPYDNQKTVLKNFDLIKFKELEELLEDDNCNYQVINYNFTLPSIYNISQNHNYIVVVDDHKLVRVNTINLIATSLSNLKINDYFILEGCDGIDLLNIVRKDGYGKIKCIFTDENMEFMNGSEAIKIIRKLEQNNKIKSHFIVSITAFDDISTRKNIINSGVDSILSKPCSKTAITEIFQKIFS